MMRLLAPVLIAAVLGTGQTALAQRRQTAMTPYGPVRNLTSTPEWRQAGGNPIIYQRIMEEKYQLAQEKAMKPQIQAMIKQQKAYEKWLADQKAKKEKGKPVDPEFQRMLDEEARMKAANEARAERAAAKKAKRSPAAKRAAAAKASKSEQKDVAPPAPKAAQAEKTPEPKPGS